MLSYTIKPLDWQYLPDLKVWVARTTFGQFIIYQNGQVDFVALDFFSDWSRDCIGVDTAKIAAWEYWCSLIKQCLEVT